MEANNTEAENHAVYEPRREVLNRLRNATPRTTEELVREYNRTEGK